MHDPCIQRMLTGPWLLVSWILYILRNSFTSVHCDFNYLSGKTVQFYREAPRLDNYFLGLCWSHSKDKTSRRLLQVKINNICNFVKGNLKHNMAVLLAICFGWGYLANWPHFLMVYTRIGHKMVSLNRWNLKWCNEPHESGFTATFWSFYAIILWSVKV